MNASLRDRLLGVIVPRMKREILKDMLDQPKLLSFERVRTFADLHDVVDANCYGGFCDDDTAELIIAACGGRDKFDDLPDAYVELMNRAQDAIDKWLRSGLAHAALAELQAKKKAAAARAPKHHLR